VTTISAVPAVPLGIVIVNWVADLKTTLVAAVPPTVTVAPFWKFAPSSVADAPPEILSVLGLILVMTGAR
jgi:hypothetical protein